MKKIFRTIVLSLLLQSINVFSQGTVSDSSLQSSFCQGSANNCASVALIKAAMSKYGYNNVFKLQVINNQYKIVLKDGNKLTITEEERLLAKNYSDFDTSDCSSLLGAKRDSVLFYTYLSYACIAKYISVNGYWDCQDKNGDSYHERKKKNYEDALIFISRISYCVDNCYRLLGLKIKDNKIFDYKESTTLDEKGIVLYSWGHAVAIYKNNLDCHGEWLPVKTKKVCWNYFKWYIILE